jgi:site-specific recombinase XerD
MVVNFFIRHDSAARRSQDARFLIEIELYRQWEDATTSLCCRVRVKAAQFGTEHINKYRGRRTEEGAALATVNRELQVVRQAFIHGYESEPPTVKKVPKFQLPKEKNARKGFATPEQLDALRAAAAKETLTVRTLVERSTEPPPHCD